MKKVIIGVFALGLFMSMSAKESAPLPINKSKETYVYICNSSGATKYHYTKNCRGLSNCKHDIIKVTLEEARKKGKKTLCGWED